MARPPAADDAAADYNEAAAPYNTNLLKELVESYRGDLSAKAEASLAEQSLYGWWWRFLKASPEYPPTGEALNDQRKKSLYEDFGDLGEDFGEWWAYRGRYLFREQAMVPLVRVVGRAGDRNIYGHTQSLTLEVPMTITREALLEQLNYIFDRFHPGEKLLRHAHSTAQRKIYPRVRYRRDKLKNLLEVWKLHTERSKLSWYEIGAQLNLSASHVILDRDSAAEQTAKRTSMAVVAKRLYTQANKIMANALIGEFPRDDMEMPWQRPNHHERR